MQKKSLLTAIDNLCPTLSFEKYHGVWKSQKKSHSTFYVYNLNGQKFIKMPKMFHFVEFLKTRRLLSNSVTRQVNLNRTKMSAKFQNWKVQMWHFRWFSNKVKYENQEIKVQQSSDFVLIMTKEALIWWTFYNYVRNFR